MSADEAVSYAVVQPRPEIAGAAAPWITGHGNKRNLLTFAPDGARGVSAFVDGEQAAKA